MPALGRNPITQASVDSADMILMMQPVHADYIHRHFKCDANKMLVPGIGDKYTKDDPGLIRELKKKVRPILQMEDRLRENWEKEREKRKRRHGRCGGNYSRHHAVI
jgi:hypothetical protein